MKTLGIGHGQGELSMDIKWLGLVGLVALATACADDSGPAEKKFFVGGTLSGLSGSLTLQLNEGKPLTRSENGPFTFDDPVTDRSTYQVTLTTLPDEQDCTVEGATGLVAGADVDSVRITCSQRTYTLGGTVEGLTGPLQLRLEGGETLSVTGSGPFAFETKLPRGSPYTVGLVAQPRGYRCAITNERGNVAGPVTSISVRCTSWLELTSTQPAIRVVGQQNFASNEPNQGRTTLGADTVEGPWGNPVFAGGRLYFSDLASNRVLGFNGLPTRSGASADFVLGQPGFTTSEAGRGRKGFESPSGLSSDGTRLAVADRGNSRVLLYSSLPNTHHAEADVVIGQPTFGEDTAPMTECTRELLRLPQDVFIGHGMLLVADTAHHRVLIWKTIPTSNGAQADLVLGQTSFTTCSPNDAQGDGAPDSTPSASTMSRPAGVWTDGTRIVVADTNNSRILIWNQFPTRNGQPADLVLGQPNFVSPAPTLSQTGLNSPYFVTSTGQQLFVSDTQNFRVLVWNQFPTRDGQPADVVLGQQGFTTSEQPSPPSDRSLDRPGGMLVTGPYLLVADQGNNRLLLFETP